MDNKSSGSKLIGVIVVLAVLVLIYFLFYSGDKDSKAIESAEISTPAAESQVKLPNVEDATPSIKNAKPLKAEEKSTQQ